MPRQLAPVVSLGIGPLILSGLQACSSSHQSAPQDDTLLVRVVDRDTHAPVPDARVSYVPRGWSQPNAIKRLLLELGTDLRQHIAKTVIADSDGFARLPAAVDVSNGDAELRIEASAGERWGRVTAIRGSDGAREILVAKDESLVVAVKNGSGSAAGGVPVELCAYFPDSEDSHVLWTAKTDARSGRALFPHLPMLRELAGDSSRIEWSVDHLGAASGPVHLPAELTNGSSIELTLPDSSSLVVSVVDGQSRRLESDHLIIWAESGMDGELGSACALASELEIPAVVPGSVVTVNARAHGWCGKTLKLHAPALSGERKSVQIQLDAPAILVRGRLLDEHGRELVCEPIELVWDRKDDWEDGSGALAHWSDGQGRFELCVEPADVEGTQGRVEILLDEITVHEHGYFSMHSSTHAGTAMRGSFTLVSRRGGETLDVGDVVVRQAPAREELARK